MSADVIPSQRHLFSIPRDVAYLNTAYMSPLLNDAVAAGDAGLRLKQTPWSLTIPDFFGPVTEARGLFAELMNADAAGVAIVPSASYGVATAARNIPVAAGQKIVMLADQFPSHVYSWRKLAARNDASIVTVAPPSGRAATESVLAAIDENCAIAALPNVLWTDGAKVDLEAVRRRCDETGAALVLDLTQSAGAMAIDFARVRPDFAVVAGYKWLMCPYTTGFLYVDPKWREGEPLEEGWITRKGAENFSTLVEYQDDYQPGAERYDMGERANFALMPAVVAALRQLKAWNIGRIEATLAARNTVLSARLGDLGLSPTPDAARGPHFLGAALPAGAPDDIVAQLAARRVFVSERGGALRVTPHLYNDDTDSDRLIEALKAIL